MAPRAHTGHGATRSETGTQLIVIKGLPRSFDFRLLKDNVRTMLPHSIPGWTVQKGCGGYISLTSVKDAKVVYAGFTKRSRGGRPLSVHHFDTSGAPPQLLQCNCYPFASCPHRGLSPPGHKCNCLPGTCMWSPSASVPPGSMSLANSSSVSLGSDITSVSSSPATSTCSVNDMVGVPIPAAVVYAPAQRNSVPVYSVPVFVPEAASTNPYTTNITPPSSSRSNYPIYTTSNGIPVNVVKGVVRTECRGVFLSNLHFSVSKADIERLLRPFGTVNKCVVRRNPSTKGRFKLTATALFDFGGQADAAVAALQKSEFKGRTLEIHLDRDETVTMPLIAHGATMSQAHSN
ncbi:hypothetical protein P152DRAFT_447271 [Eremomyces bilateralis CBS 781.70]|uniref:RRM domain-containing protein n=1 Tax=Eremomyces bilateralis CBS 781.70 TaxID=1392243 RepID=A0A6G1GA85_9PEZI|nr:uncharacterized protein P152DRAFT_447271 [Eremomyces bilateralis CBS 781.70]KAF1814997.1 hypothetical protein P152DRAFT_447271 [Eremomyces bilateralis CBS 781.70]